MATTYDAIIIGTGQAGPSLAVRLASTGMKVAIIERKRFGGTCVNTGCIPTKTLIASARAAHVARRAGDFGVTIDGSIAVDMKKIKQRKDEVVRRSNEGLESWLKNTANLAVYQGHARFADTHQVHVGDELLNAEKIFINVGGRAATPALPGVRSGERFQQLDHDGSGLSARASYCRRRQLRGFGVCADVPPLWQRGHNCRDGATAHSARRRRHLRSHQANPRKRKASTSD